MNDVVFDLAASAGSARHAFGFALAAALLALALLPWSRWRRQPAGVLTLWLGGVALLCGAVGAAQAAERRMLLIVRVERLPS